MSQLLSKEDIKGYGKKKKERASNWKSVLYRIWKLVDEQRGLLITVLALVFVSSVLALLGPLMIGKIIDNYIIPMQFDGSWRQYWPAYRHLYWPIICDVFSKLWMVGIAQQTIFRLRTSLFAHLQKLPVTFFDKRQHGELMSRVTNDIENVSQTLNSSFIQVFSSILTLTGTFAVMLYLSPLLTLLTMIIVPVMFIAIRWITRRTGFIV